MNIQPYPRVSSITTMLLAENPEEADWYQQHMAYARRHNRLKRRGAMAGNQQNLLISTLMYAKGLTR